MADEQGLEARVIALFADRLQTNVPASDSDLFETGVLDSLRFVELLAALEETFGLRVSVDELDIEDFRTVSRIADFLSEKQPAPRG